MKHRLTYWLVAATLGTLPLLMLVLLARPAAAAESTSQSSMLNNSTGETLAGETLTTPVLVYLPLLIKPLPGIQGHVTYNGLPESGAYLELRLFDGQSYATHLSTYTDSNGFYNFNGAASLAPGQSYYVRYRNTGGTPGRLWFWGTTDITAYSAGGALGAGDFDLGDVSLSAPNPGATVALPALFQWVRRPATPSDSYQLTLFDPQGDAFGQTVPLGYVDGIVLTGLPSDFHSGTEYGWEVDINSPDGGFGVSYYYHPIHFSNLAANSAAAVAGGAAALPATRPVDRPRP